MLQFDLLALLAWWNMNKLAAFHCFGRHHTHHELLFLLGSGVLIASLHSSFPRSPFHYSQSFLWKPRKDRLLPSSALFRVWAADANLRIQPWTVDPPAIRWWRKPTIPRLWITFAFPDEVIWSAVMALLVVHSQWFGRFWRDILRCR